jgi:plasmid replication initiation protein
MSDEKNTKKLVTKDYKLINSRYRLSVLEQRIILDVVAHITPDDVGFLKHSILLKDIVKTNNHKEMKEATDKLMTRFLTIEKEDGSWKKIGWVNTIEYESKTGLIHVKINEDLKPYLLQLKSNFKSYNLENVLRMKSEYSIRMYEILKQREKIKIYEVDLEELYKILDVPKSYKKYTHFKKRVLEQVEKEINAHTDIKIKYEEIKESRKVHKLKFYISKSKWNDLINEQQELNKFVDKINKEYNGHMLFKDYCIKYNSLYKKVFNFEKGKEDEIPVEKEEMIKVYNYLFVNKDKIYNYKPQKEEINE